ncbi:MAG: NAD(P)/FAD-dependent oxidoreductase [Gordonia sp. (in: high G+C Gram-positive bacteria)]|uniref:flavin-containing monooxygenase n=1 Tax=Gordonia sp. (in: high G+C Gram-positive bacteria) TaxID=84139 RepID=UPI0039E6407A
MTVEELHPTDVDPDALEVDVLVIGAGISGIGAACRLAQHRPELDVRIVERRQRIGGTWDLFRYPGIRSDSDMFTFGYDFAPWTQAKVLADGPSIREYVEQTAARYGVTDRIDFGITVRHASWSTEEQRWSLLATDDTGAERHYVARFVVGCTGYYDFDHGYRPEFPDETAFRGTIVHPQHWPEDLDYRGKRVAVIGSGATAVTLVPNMAEDTAHITMIQRSPTYVVPLPAVNRAAAVAMRFLPEKPLFAAVRTAAAVGGRVVFGATRTFPGTTKRALTRVAAGRLRPEIDIKHFTPSYKPWDQRICVVPDGDLFKSLNSGAASIVTGTIEKFTPTGVQMTSGEHVDADIIVTATGLNVQFNGGIDVLVDGEPVVVADRLTYKAVMLEGVPNALFIFGYTNASWTLKVGLATHYLTRLLGYMANRGYGVVVPTADGAPTSDETVFGSLTAGYVLRAADTLPKQGRSGVWKVRHDYVADYVALRLRPIADDALHFTPAKSRRRARVKG